MSDSQRLTQWMQDRGFDFGSLAEATGDSYSSIYLMVKGQRPVNDAFKWRFAQRFGWAEAAQLFAKDAEAVVA